MNIYLNSQVSICPCKNCNDRKVGCHSICDKYIEWTSSNEKIREKEKITNVNTSYGWGYIPRKKRNNN